MRKIMCMALVACILINFLTTPFYGLMTVNAATNSYSWEFDTDGNTMGWVLAGGIAPGAQVSNEIMQFDINGDDPSIWSPENLGITAQECTKIVFRMKINAADLVQLFWEVDNDPMSEKCSLKFEPIADGQFHEYVFNLRDNTFWHGIVNRIRIDPNSGINAHVEFDYIKVIPAGADLKCNLGRSSLVVKPSTTFKVYAVLENKGDSTAIAPQAVLSLPQGLSLVSGSDTVVADNIEPLGKRVVSWDVSGNTGQYTIQAAISGTNILTQSLSMSTIIADDQSSNTLRSSVTPNIYTTSNGSVILENTNNRVVFIKDATGFLSYRVDVWNGSEWYQMAATQPFSSVQYEYNGKQEKKLFPTSYSISQPDANNAEVTFNGTFTDAGNAVWSYTFKFGVVKDQPDTKVTYTISSSDPRGIYRFEGPVLRVGDNSFGKVKKDAIFPGLEWLEGEEESSAVGPDFKNFDANRLVPKYHKITMPVMSVAKDNYVVSLDWDPQQVWHGTSKLPSAQFSVPNKVEAMDNSSIGVFLPSTYDGKVRENNLSADIAYDLPAGEQMQLVSNIYAGNSAGDGAIKALEHYINKNTPTLPAGARSNSETIELSKAAYLTSMWDSARTGWVDFYQNSKTEPGSGSYPKPEYIADLYRYSLYTTDQTKKNEARTRVNEAKAALDSRYGTKAYKLELPYYVGGFVDSLKEEDYNIESIISSQKEDGNWPYEGNILYGEPGASQMGVTAPIADNLLDNAQITGSRRVLESALRGVDAVNRYLIPRGAQSWESSLHSPDMLAAAYGVKINVKAYEITNNPVYKDNAVIWAKKGLPFMYTWKADNKLDAMKFSTIPLFCASWYWRSWVGMPVFWNGLEYGYGLRKLSNYDSSCNWDLIAEGILRSVTYTQNTGSEFYGTLPDVYMLSSSPDWFGWPWIIPTSVLENAFESENFAYGSVNSATVTDDIRRYTVNSAGAISSAAIDSNKKLSFNISYPSGETSYSTVSGLIKPGTVKKNGTALNYYDDLSAVNEGWSYTSNVSGLVIVKLAHSTSPIAITVENCIQSPEWSFSNNSNNEGWAPGGQVGSISVLGGRLIVTPNGDSPSITKAVTMQASDYAKVVVNARNTAGKLLKLSWKSSSQTWDNSRSLTKGIVDNNTYKNIIFDLSKVPTWTGTISDIKLEWVDTKTSETITIDNIRFVKDIVTKNGEMEWDFNTDITGWSAANQISNYSVSNGNLSGTSTGADPIIYSSDNLDIIAKNTPIMQIRLKSSNNGFTEMFYNLPPAYNNDSASRSATLPLIGTGRFYDYALNMKSEDQGPVKWNMDLMGLVKRLRYDPIDAGNTNFDIDYIGFLREPDQQYYHKFWSFDTTIENWTSASGLSSPSNEGGSLKVNVTGSNPRLLSPVTNIDSKYQYLIMRLKKTGGSKATIRWAYDSQLISPERKQEITLKSDNDYHVYVVKLSHNTYEWMGTVKQLAIDFDSPVNSQINIDYIKIGEFIEQDKDFTWSVDGDTEGWNTKNSLGALTVNEGLLSTTVTGIDPFISGPIMSVPASDYPILRVRMAVSQGNYSELFWTTDTDQNESSTKRAGFPVIPDGKLRTYEVYMANHPLWKDNIRTIRLDLGSDTPGTTVKFDYVRLIKEKDKNPIVWDLTRNGSSKGWSDSGYYSNLTNPVYNSSGLTWTINGSNPNFSGPLTDIDASRYRYLKIVMTTPNGNGTKGGIYWLKKDGTWNENDKVEFNLTSNGTEREYYIDLSSSSAWSGMIKQLRIDPIQDPGAPSGTVVIKEISLMP